MKPDFSSGDTAREEVLQKLPLAVTSIKPQKKNIDRFSLFHDTLFLIGVSSQTLLDFSIQKGFTLTPQLFRELSLSEEYQSVKERCFGLLSRRDHGAEELKRKVIRKGFSEEIAGRVIEELQSKDLLNDHQYAKSFAHDKYHLKSWGPRKIESALYNKGVPKRVVTDVIRELKDEIDPSETCLELALKRRKHFMREPDKFKRKQKIFRYLAGKGYSSDIIRKAIPQILEQMDA